MTDLSTIRAAVLAEAPGSTKRGSWRHTLFLLLAVHAAAVGLALAVGLGLFSHGPSFRGSTSIALGLAIAANVFVALAPSAGRLARRCALFVAALSVALHVSSFHTVSQAPLWADADCALAELGASALPLAATLLWMRHFAYRALPSVAGATAAALAGLLVLDLACPASGIAHVLAFHVAPGLLVVGLGLWVRRQLVSLTQVP